MEKITTTIPNSVITRIRKDENLIQVYTLQKGYKPILYVAMSQDIDGLYCEVISYGSQEITNCLAEIPRDTALMEKTCNNIVGVLVQFFKENEDEDIKKLKIANNVLDYPLKKDESELIALLTSVRKKEA